MTILFVGNNSVDFFGKQTGDYLQTSTFTNLRDTALVNDHLSNTNVDDNMSYPFGINLGAAYTDMWVHFRFRTADISSSAVSGYMLSFRDASNNLIGRLDFQSDDLFCVAYGSGGSASSAVIDGFPAFTNMTFDVRMQQTGGNNIITLYLNGAFVRQASFAQGTRGAPQTVIWDTFDMVDANDQTLMWSEFIITSDEPTRGWRLAVLPPTAAGFHTDWTGPVTSVNSNDLLTAINGDANLEKNSYTLTYNAPATDAGIRAVIAKAIASRAPIGPANMRQFVRIGGTDYEGAQHALTLGQVDYMHEWAVDPATSGAWSSTTIAAMEIGVKAET